MPPDLTVDQLVSVIKGRFATWRAIWLNGTTDPFYQDGTNLNLIRNHIIYYQDQLVALCKRDGISLPKAAEMAPPREMPHDWLATRSKAGKHAVVLTARRVDDVRQEEELPEPRIVRGGRGRKVRKAKQLHRGRARAGGRQKSPRDRKGAGKAR